MGNVVKYIIGICAVAVCVGAGVFGMQMLLAGDDDSAQQGEERQPTTVGAASPEIRKIEDTVAAVGTLRPIRAVEIVPNGPGRVTEVPVSSGQDVAEGDLLLQLDDRAARAAVADAEATLSETEQDYQRYQQLEDSNVAAQASLEQTRAAYRRAEAALVASQATLDDLTITAPFAGTLGVIDTEPGAFLSGNEVVTTLSDLSHVEVSVTLPERYFDRVMPGQTLIVTTPAYPDATFSGEVTLRSDEIDLGTRSFEVRARIDNADGRLVGGMFAKAQVVLDTYDGLAIPDDAVISEGLATYVYTIADGTASRRDVTVGASLGEMIEVREGLDQEDRVVVAGWDQLSDGAPVEVDEDFSGEGLE